MLKVFKYPEVPDQDKPDSGDLLFGIQDGKSVTPLPFYTNGNNSAIVSFTAVEFDQFRNEKSRISLDTTIIDVDVTNNIYNVDSLTDYVSALDNGVYRFEFQNDSNLWKTEYFKVTDQDLTTPKILITMTPTALFTAGINLTFASGTLTIDWKDGSPTENFVSGVELTHQYVDAGTNIAEITGDLTNITKFIADNSRITFISNLITGLLTEFNINTNLYSGVLDMSLAPVSGIFRPYSNAGLTGITFATTGNGLIDNLIIRFTAITSLDFSNVPVSGLMEIRNNSLLINLTFATSGNSKVTSFNLKSNNLTGTLDLSDVPVGGTFEAIINPNLTGINYSLTGNSIITIFDVSFCGLTGVLDLSNVPIGGTFRVNTNSLLTGVTHSLTGNSVTTVHYTYSCNLTGTLDLTNVPTGTNVISRFNSLLTNVLLSAAGNGAINIFDMDGCSLPNIDLSVYATSTPSEVDFKNNSLSATEHDNQLINLDGTGWINGTLEIITGNTARTAASDTAYNNLIANGWTIT